MKIIGFARAAVSASALAAALAACTSNPMENPMDERSHMQNRAAYAAPASVPSRQRADTLIAVMTMKPGFSPSDHDAYEARVAPIAAEHGMNRSTALSVTQFVGGAGPRNASTIGFWSLQSADSVQSLMGDPRYQAQISHRDQIHDMANLMMYSARETIAGAPAPAGHVLLVGLIAMKPGFSFDDHAAYEARMASISARHGMQLVRA